jgi:2-oxoglutarate ferredoxin oxidoreductase subunit alpha
MPVIVLSDLDLGMNQWMTKKYEYPNSPMDRGKILWEDDLEKMIQDRKGDWGRYLDIDGDGIPYRTVVGNTHPKGSYFTRGTGHDAYTRYSEEPDVWEHNLDRLARKYKTAKNYVPKPEIQIESDAEFGIIAFGSTEMAVFEARHIWKNNQKSTNYCRIRSIPFTAEVGEFIKTNKSIFVVELNRDGQMCQLLRMEYPEYASKFISICHIDGLPLTAKWLQNEIEQHKENL